MSQDIPFWKLESIGNDFPLVHTENVKGVPLEDLAVAICDRRFGVGGDGLLALQRGEPLRLRMFNPDGTEDFCGNGIRCAAFHASAMGWEGARFEIAHGDQVVPIEIGGDDNIATALAGASYSPSRVPLAEGISELFRTRVYWDEQVEIVGSALTTGSTHVVIPVAELPTDEELAALGPKIENFQLYPIRTSVIWSETVGPDHLKIRIWERGVGETLGCGTGSSAAAADYLRSEGRGGRVQVDNRGGTVLIEAAEWNSKIVVIGRAKTVFEGEYRTKT